MHCARGQPWSQTPNAPRRHGHMIKPPRGPQEVLWLLHTAAKPAEQERE